MGTGDCVFWYYLNGEWCFSRLFKLPKLFSTKKEVSVKLYPAVKWISGSIFFWFSYLTNCRFYTKASVLSLLHTMACQSCYRVNQTCSVPQYTSPFSFQVFTLSSHFFHRRFRSRPLHHVRGEWPPPFSLCLSVYLSQCLPHTHSVTTSDQQAALIYSQQLKRDIEQVLLSEPTMAFL